MPCGSEIDCYNSTEGDFKCGENLILTMAVILMTVLLAGCGLMEEAAVEIVRETYGDEYADAYTAEYNAADGKLPEYFIRR